MWLIVAAVLATVVIGGAAGIAASGGWPDLVVGSATAAPGSSADGRSSGGSGGSAGAPTADVVPATATSLVRLDGTASVSPDGPAVLALLDRHFTAVNQKDFDTWTSTVTATRANGQSPSHWQTVYRSTTDSDVVITSINPSSSGLLVTLRFVSQQDPAAAPADLPVECIRRGSQWPVVDGA